MNTESTDMNSQPMNETPRKPWIVPAATEALEPQDIANSYQLHQDSNPHANNDAS